MHGRHCSILCALLLLGSLSGQEAAVDIGQAVQELGAKSFQVRKQARKTLARIGWAAKAELEKATKHPDPEVADVARQLLAAMLPGVSWDTPERQRRLVKAYLAADGGSTPSRFITELVDEKPPPMPYSWRCWIGRRTQNSSKPS